MIPRWPLCAALVCVSFLAVAQPNPAAVRFQFKEPRAAAYRLEQTKAASRSEWLHAWPDDGSTNAVQISSRLAVKLKSPADLKRLLAGHALTVNQTISSNGFVLQAPDAWTALQEAQRLAQLPEVLVSCPVMRQPLGLHGAYASKPNDPYFANQWNLENRNSNGAPVGIDLNARAAWPTTHGEGIIIGIADTGVEYTHPDLAGRSAAGSHFNFINSTTNALPVNTADNHGTAVAGLAVAELNNQIGISGIAPGAQVASWKIFTGETALQVDDQGLMNMFQYQSNTVAVQNHSWGFNTVRQLGPGYLASQGIDNAIQFGRGGRGVVMTRSAGNRRVGDGSGSTVYGNANDDGYVSNPNVIAAGAVRSDGRVASYSNPGACLMLAAPSDETADTFYSRDPSFRFLFTTDRQGTDGYNTTANTNDYVFGGNGLLGVFGLTSAAAPQIAGMAALILSANTNLSYRDVQQILIQSARPIDLTDSDIVTNGAGFRVSHNVGFGLPDAGFAVALAKQWPLRPARTNLSFIATDSFTEDIPAAIPDDGLRVMVSNAPAFLQNISSTPSLGLHVGSATAFLPLVEVTNMANSAITQNLTNKAALIQRGVANFSVKIQNAANAGAAFAIIYNNSGTTNRQVMGATDFAPIPAVFISLNNGVDLRNFLQTNSSASVQMNLLSTNYTFNVTNTLLCEQVGVRVRTSHPRRADVRLTLLSPSGTRSVLQRLNTDTAQGPVDWTYYSTHHFYESSAGNWTVAFSDEDTTASGSALYVELILYGVAITDSDHDGLDDNWEKTNFANSLAFGPKEDADKDGFNNMREQIMGTNPNQAGPPFQLDLSRWDNKLARLSWPASSNYTYEVRSGTNVAGLTVSTNLPGKFPVTELFSATTNAAPGFFSIRAVPTP
jgi:subtilisin family serine protease/subtilisin-like proprotein convertase family protein